MATKTFLALAVGSASSGIMLQDGLRFIDMAEISGHALGFPVWTHELGDRAMMLRVSAAIRNQFPLMPDKEMAARDWAAAAAIVTEAYGQTVDLVRGTETRAESPIDTARRVMGNADGH